MKFTQEFKEKSIRLKKEGIPPNEVFKSEGVSIEDKQKDYASKLINKWRKELNKTKSDLSSIDILKEIKKESESKRVEYLETKVAYLEAENSFLASLPKKKK